MRHEKRAAAATHGMLLCAVMAFPLPPAWALPAGGAAFPTHEGRPIRAEVRLLAMLQDSQMSGLIPFAESGDGAGQTTTYVNAMAVFAFTAVGQFERARRILDVFAPHGDPCPGMVCQGGYQQFRDAATGAPIQGGANDFWIGDDAWLLAAAKYYQRVTGDNRYEPLVLRLKGWLECLKSLTPEPGIYSGFHGDCSIMAFRHAEGSIDVYGSLKDLGVEPVRSSIKQWLDASVWIPRDSCFERGPDNAQNLPLDHVSWGYLALGPDYRCILPFAEGLNARHFDPYQIEVFDREGAWGTAVGHEGVQVALSRDRNGEGHDLVGTYSIVPGVPSGRDWFLLYRDAFIDLEVTPGFRFVFQLKGDGSGHQFEVKLYNKRSIPGEPDRVYWYHFPLNFTDWRRFKIRHDQFVDFTPNGGQPLSRIAKIEFALNSGGQPATNSQFRIGEIRYFDMQQPILWGVDGFGAFQSDRGSIFVEGTAQMAAAYCVAGAEREWSYLLRELEQVMEPAFGGAARGLPSFLTGGTNRPVPGPVATSWDILARRCVNPF